MATQFTDPRKTKPVGDRIVGEALVAINGGIGEHDHPITADIDSGLEAAETIQALAEALSTRIKALEVATGG